jgi:hypothetical protein
MTGWNSSWFGERKKAHLARKLDRWGGYLWTTVRHARSMSTENESMKKSRQSKQCAGVRFARGTNKQTLKDGTVRQRGPFFKITSKDGMNKTVSLTVPKDKKEYMRAEVENYQRFRKLADEYADVCEQISVLTEQGQSANIKEGDVDV